MFKLRLMVMSELMMLLVVGTAAAQTQGAAEPAHSGGSWFFPALSAFAVAIAALIGFALGGMLAVYRFPGRGVLAALLNALMGLPPVVAGLFSDTEPSRATS